MGIYDIQKPLLREIVGDNSSTAEIYHTFIRDGQYEGRRALVKRNESGFLVELYLNNQLKETREVYEKAEIYAENIGENWVLGIIKE